MTPRTLIADDQPDVLEALRLLLKREGYQIEAVNSPAAVLESVKARDFDLLLMDLNYARDTTSGQEGLDLLARVQSVDRDLPVVVMTAWGNVPLAVEAMRRGARDFVEKPWDNSRLLTTVRAQIEARRSARVVEGQELDEAAAIQRDMLPQEIPQLVGYGLAAAWRPARAVSGDYLDMLKLSDRHLALCVADGIGKGVPAALLVSNLQAAVRSVASERVAPSELVSKINRLVSLHLAGGRFITCCYAVIDDERKRLIYTNAGNNAPMLVREDGDLVRLDSGGPVLGVFRDCAYAQAEVELRSSDRLVLFTDGIVEVENAAGEPFGEDRLAAVLTAHRALNAAALKKHILASVTEFSDGQFQDDATLLVLAVN